MRKSGRSLVADRQPEGLKSDFQGFLDNLARALFDRYRPELHYMRGPGPKWHAKHDAAPADFEQMPVLVRVPVKG